jgi:bacterioferritin-associated ferredoxin
MCVRFGEEITDRIVCHCLQVRESTVADAVAIYGAESVRDVIRVCSAGSGCTCCHAKIRELIEAHGVTDAGTQRSPATDLRAVS